MLDVANEALEDSLPEVREAAEFSLTRRFDKAVPLLERALEICEHSMGPNHPMSRAAGIRLAGVHAMLAEYPRAEKLLLRLLSQAESSAGDGQSPDTELLTLDSLIQLYLSQADVDAARPLCIRAIEVAKELKDSEGQCAALSQLGVTQLLRGQEVAADTFAESIRVAEENSTNADGKARGLRNLGCFHFTVAKDPQGALDQWGLALDAIRLELPLDFESMSPSAVTELLSPAQVHLATEMSELMANQGHALLRLDDGEGAEAVLSRAVKLQDQVLRERDPRQSRSLILLGRAMHKLERPVMAEGLIRTAVDNLCAEPVLTEAQKFDLSEGYRSYSALCADWEKRETEAAELQAKGREISKYLRMIPNPITSMIRIH